MKKTKNLISKTIKCLLVFGIIFSQMSFPLSVLADEVSNGEKKEVETSIIQEESQEKTMDSKQADTTGSETTDENQTEADNNEDEPTNDETTPVPDTPTPELPGTDVPGTDEPKEDTEVSDIEVEVKDEHIIIKNTLEKTINLKLLKQQIENITTVSDKDGVEITDEEQILYSNTLITVTVENEETEEPTSTTYTLIILGDYDNDGQVTLNDQQELLKLLKASSKEELLVDLVELDLNEDEEFNILDVTHPIFTTGSWKNENIATDELTNYLIASDEEIYKGQEIEVNYFVKGFETDKLMAIQGILNYNKELLKLTKVQINGLEIEELENNFAYLLNGYNTDGILMTLTFEALELGTPVVSIEEIIASLDGIQAKLDNDKVSTEFNIIDGKGGGEPSEEDKENTETDTEQEEAPKEEVKTETTEKTPENTTTVVRPTVYTKKSVVLSSDNLIKSLTIKGHDIKFDKNTYEYSIKVDSKVSSLDLTVLLNDEKATYSIEGNDKFKTGENTVTITVKAEDGSTKTYTIKVTKEKAPKEAEEEKEEKSSSKTIIIILIILVIIGLIYVIFKDDEEEQQEVKPASKKSNKSSKKGSKK